MSRQWKKDGKRPFVLLRDLVPRQHPLPPSASPALVCLAMICRREEQHMWPLSVDEHVQCHCQIVRSGPTPHCLGPAPALETRTHTHAQISSTRTTARLVSWRSKPCELVLKQSFVIDRSRPHSDESGLRRKVKKLHAEFVSFLFALLQYHSQHGWLNAKRPCQTCLETNQTALKRRPTPDRYTVLPSSAQLCTLAYFVAKLCNSIQPLCFVKSNKWQIQIFLCVFWRLWTPTYLELYYVRRHIYNFNSAIAFGHVD